MRSIRGTNGTAPDRKAPATADLIVEMLKARRAYRHSHAARTVARNSSTSCRSLSACRDSSPAAPSTCAAAAPVSVAERLTPSMLVAISLVPWAA